MKTKTNKNTNRYLDEFVASVRDIRTNPHIASATDLKKPANKGIYERFGAAMYGFVTHYAFFSHRNRKIISLLSSNGMELKEVGQEVICRILDKVIGLVLDKTANILAFTYMLINSELINIVRHMIHQIDKKPVQYIRINPFPDHDDPDTSGIDTYCMQMIPSSEEKAMRVMEVEERLELLRDRPEEALVMLSTAVDHTSKSLALCLLSKGGLNATCALIYDQIGTLLPGISPHLIPGAERINPKTFALDTKDKKAVAARISMIKHRMFVRLRKAETRSTPSDEPTHKR